jgi:hypothetical protein|nr:MAG TPA: hypothetical protein [Caudoviricetes sp.]
MKISELSTERAADVLCEITPYIANITGDKDLLDELAIKFDSKGKSVAELYIFAANKYAQLTPILLKDHRSDVFCVLSILNETTAEQIRKQKFIDTLKQVGELFKDKELMDFFKSFWQEDESE